MTEPRRRIWLRFVVAFVLLVAILVAAALAFLPSWVRSRAVLLARRQGVELTVGQVSLSWGSVRMYALEARVNELPHTLLVVPEVDVELDGFTPIAMHVKAPDLTVGADVALLETQRTAFRTAHPVLDLAGITRVTFEGGRVRWPEVLSGTSVLMTGVAGDASGAQDLADERHATVEHLVVERLAAGAIASYGPWAVRYEEKGSRASTLKLVLDPAHEADAVVTMTTTDRSAARADVHVKRARFATLGIPAAELVSLGGAGAAGLNPEIEIEAHETAGAGEGAVRFTAWAVPLPRLGVPGDATIDLAWTGASAGHPVPLTRGAFALGPFEGTVSGTIGPPGSATAGAQPFGFRADLSFRSKPVPCARFASLAATEALGALGKRLGDLAEQTGLTRAVTGSTEISGQVVLDTSALDTTRYGVKPTVDCGLFPLKP